MALIKLCFAFLIFCLACGAIGSFFVFLFDVVKWHLQEKRIVISASAQKLPKMFEGGEVNGRDNNSDTGNNGTSDGDSDNSRSSDGDSDGNCGSISDTGSESRERNASAIFDSWLQP